MPLINGMKMACEPCIRGHRSTKCTHANERLMVPVRKPGRPLSQCPHPGGQSCMCGSVTAAIPRKQTCHCGGEGSKPAQAPVPAPQIVPRSSSQGAPGASSPTKPAFKVQKAPRPASSSRKQSFDPSNFGRIDMNSVNVIPFKQRSQNIPVPVTSADGYAMAGQAQVYGYNAQFANIQPQLSHASMQPPPSPYDGEDPLMRANGFGNGLANGGIHHEKPYVVESPLPTPSIYGNGNSGIAMNGTSYGPPTPLNGANGESKPYTNGSSCCAQKQNGHNRTSSLGAIIPEHQEPTSRGCCSSKSTPVPKQEPGSSNDTPISTHISTSPQILAQGNMSFNPAVYQQLVSNQPTVFTYPPTYGSFQNPLQPSAWRLSTQNNIYGQPQPHPQTQIPPHTQLPFDAQLVPDTMNTIHTCDCGDGCQCIGCAAHPYNNATQDYVRSAWTMSAEQYTGEMYGNGQSTGVSDAHGNANGNANGNGNGNGSAPPQSADATPSPTPRTPSSTSSVSGEEQSLSASDFFFVNYPFSSDGCGGDTLSCPCGDDCQCIGCTIHRQPAIPCGGEKGSCPCGDNCECIGCSMHNGGVTT